MKTKIIGVKSSERNGDETDFVIFKLSDVNYINLSRPQKNSEQVPLYHTSKGSFYPLLTLKDVSLALKPLGFDFIDKSTVINRKRVKNYYKVRTGLEITFVDNSVINVSSRSKHH